MTKIFGIILGGGKSERFETDKLACLLGDESVIARTHRILKNSKQFDDIFIVSEKDYGIESKFIHPGSSRFESMCNGVEEILKNFDELKEQNQPKYNSEIKNTFVLIHNGANPGVTSQEITACLEGAIKTGACGTAHKVTDTIRRPGTGRGDGTFKIIDRENLYAMQTPQCIRLDLLLRGIEYVKGKIGCPTDSSFGKQANAFAISDDLQLLDLINQNSDQKIAYTLTPASETNFKITTKEDAKKMCAVLGVDGDNERKQRVGVGQDSHEFSENQNAEKMNKAGEKSFEDCLILGGVKFKNYPKLKANSDGDVILHALFNAISSALGEGSLGQTADHMCKSGILDSQKYLDVILGKMESAGYAIGNLSISLICKEPKIDENSDDLKASLIGILKPYCSKNFDKNIGITATTGEGLYNENSIACTCIVSLI